MEKLTLSTRERPVEEWKNVPYEVKLAASTRFGRDVEQMVALKDSSYRGDVLNLESYIAQRDVAANRVVLHPKKNLTFATDEIKRLDESRKLNGAELRIEYVGDRGRVYPYDRQRDGLEELVTTMKRTASVIRIPDLERFTQNLDAVRDAMLQSLENNRAVERMRGSIRNAPEANSRGYGQERDR
jgi:putative DNA primase/helicase